VTADVATDAADAAAAAAADLAAAADAVADLAQPPAGIGATVKPRASRQNAPPSARGLRRVCRAVFR
jgi:hypothetical protein